MNRKYILLLITLPLITLGAYYDTLPKGVRTLVYKRVQTGTVNGSFDQSGNFQSMDQNFSIDSQTLSGVDGFASTAQDIQSVAPEAWEQLSIGKYRLGAEANIKVNALALGWGLSERLTAYGFIPYFNAQVNMEFERTGENNYQAVGTTLRSNNLCTDCQSAANAVENNLPDLGASEFQGVITQDLGYKPLGSWHGKGFGDAELGFIYRVHKKTNWGSAISLGVTAPTGRIDDPNLLQDISFGDGQWDLFAEVGGAVHFLDKFITVNSFIRYTHQFASEKKLRLGGGSGIGLSSQIGLFNQKLGNKALFSINSEFLLSKIVTITPGFQFEMKGSDSYESQYTEANIALAEASNSNKFNYRLQLELSSIELFKAKKFPLPGKFVIGYQKTFAGLNTTKLNQIDAELRLFF